jgi:hypothetical protein
MNHTFIYWYFHLLDIFIKIFVRILLLIFIINFYDICYLFSLFIISFIYFYYHYFCLVLYFWHIIENCSNLIFSYTLGSKLFNEGT